MITAPNMLHVEIASAAAAAGKAVFCEKPVGGTPAQVAAAERAARHVTTGVGYNYRWAPLVQYAKALIDAGSIGTITNYRGRFLSCYGNDPLGALSWRYLVDEGGYGVSSDLLSHSVDLAHFLVGEIVEVVGVAGDVHHRTTAAGAGRHALRPWRGRWPNRRGHQRGLRRRHRPLRQRRARHVRVVTHDGRPREPERVRRPRHARLAVVEPRAAQRAGRSKNRTARTKRPSSHPRIHDGVRRRALRRPRGVRAGPGQPDRLRGSRHDRGPPFPDRGRRAPGVRPRLRRRPRLRQGAGGAARVVGDEVLDARHRHCVPRPRYERPRSDWPTPSLALALAAHGGAGSDGQ